MVNEKNKTETISCVRLYDERRKEYLPLGNIINETTNYDVSREFRKLIFSNGYTLTYIEDDNNQKQLTLKEGLYLLTIMILIIIFFGILL